MFAARELPGWKSGTRDRFTFARQETPLHHSETRAAILAAILSFARHPDHQPLDAGEVLHQQVFRSAFGATIPRKFFDYSGISDDLSRRRGSVSLSTCLQCRVDHEEPVSSSGRRQDKISKVNGVPIYSVNIAGYYFGYP